MEAFCKDSVEETVLHSSSSSSSSLHGLQREVKHPMRSVRSLRVEETRT